MAARFINIDLDVESKSSLDYFSAQMVNGTDVFILHSGDNGSRGYMARLECADGGDTCEPDSIINAFCEQIETLDNRARADWDNSYLKSFDLGFEFDGDNPNYICPIREATISRMSSLGASLGISIYNHDKS